MDNKAMCDSLAEARHNRERIKQGKGNLFFREQEAMREGWKLGELPPVGLKIGTVPQIEIGKLVWRSRTSDLPLV